MTAHGQRGGVSTDYVQVTHAARSSEKMAILRWRHNMWMRSRFIKYCAHAAMHPPCTLDDLLKFNNTAKSCVERWKTTVWWHVDDDGINSKILLRTFNGCTRACLDYSAVYFNLLSLTMVEMANIIHPSSLTVQLLGDVYQRQCIHHVSRARRNPRRSISWVPLPLALCSRTLNQHYNSFYNIIRITMYLFSWAYETSPPPEYQCHLSWPGFPITLVLMVIKPQTGQRYRLCWSQS